MRRAETSPLPASPFLSGPAWKLRFRTCFVALPAEVQHPVDHYPAHLLQGRRAVLAGVVGNGLDVDEDVARDDPCVFAVAVIERDDVGEVIVPEVLAVHLQQPLRRAENIGDVAQRVALPCGHFVQPSCREALLRESVGAVVGKVSDSHFFRCCYVVVRPGADGVPATARNRMKRRFYFRKHSSARIFCPGLGG